MSRTDPQFKLRMPPALRAQVELAAWKANRSLNAEIVTRLQASFEQTKPEVSANDQPEPVPAIAPEGLRLPELLCPQSAGQDVRLSPSPARRELRLLCLLVKPKLATAEARRLPVHTMHRLPPRTMAHGRWAELCDSCLVLRETQAVEPTTEVLERCQRHRQTHPFRAPSRTVRTGGVIA